MSSRGSIGDSNAQGIAQKDFDFSPLTQIDGVGHAHLRDAVTILLPTVAGRAHFLRTVLEHFRRCGLRARVIVADHSAASERHLITDLVADVRGLDVTVVHHPPETHFLDRMTSGAREATTKYVVIHADDDYMFLPAMLRSVQWLDSDASYVACQGRTFFMRVEASGTAQPSVQRCLSREEDFAGARIAAHCDNYTPTFYAVTRTDAFIKALSTTTEFTRNVIFWQYLSSCFVLAQGRLKTLDDLYYLRLDNPLGWRSTLVKERDNSHWPYLLTSADFSLELAKFKTGLRSVLDPLTSDKTADMVDDCCLALIRRALGFRGVTDEAETQLLERLVKPGLIEHFLLQDCAARSAEALQQSQKAGDRVD